MRFMSTVSIVFLLKLFLITNFSTMITRSSLSAFTSPNVGRIKFYFMLSYFYFMSPDRESSESSTKSCGRVGMGHMVLHV